MAPRVIRFALELDRRAYSSAGTPRGARGRTSAANRIAWCGARAHRAGNGVDDADATAVAGARVVAVLDVECLGSRARRGQATPRQLGRTREQPYGRAAAGRGRLTPGAGADFLDEASRPVEGRRLDG